MENLQASSRQINLTVINRCLPLFLGLVRSGFWADIHTGCSLDEILCTQVGIAPDYLQDRIQTVFLNNSPVDDLSSATVPDGAVISLSAAMPGLNGAVMRRGGPLSQLRHSISLTSDSICERSVPGRITLKFFNLIAREIGPQFLSQGIVVSGSAIGELLESHAPDLRQGITSAEVDNTPCRVEVLMDQNWLDEQVLLQVKPKND
jgi:hypothetical protein